MSNNSQCQVRQHWALRRHSIKYRNRTVTSQLEFKPGLAGVIISGLFAAFCCQSTIGGQVETFRVGLDRQGKVGRWLPVEMTATDLPVGETVRLQAAFPDPRGDICIETVAVAEVPDSGTLRMTGFVRSGRLEGTARFSVVHEDKVVCRHLLLFHEEDAASDEQSPVQRSLTLHRMGVISLLTVGEVEGIPEFLRNSETLLSGPVKLRNHFLESVAELPEQLEGLDAVDLILLTDDFSLSERQAEAIKQWVTDGGHLIVSTGGTVPQLLESSIGGWLTQYFELGAEPVEMRRFSNLEAFVPGASRIQTNLRGRQAWPVAAIGSNQTAVLVDSLDGPIVGRQSIGGGVVTLVAVDINQPPFDRWPSLPQFYEVLFYGKKLQEAGSVRGSGARISQSGVTDIGTQLLATVDATPPGGRWSAWSIMAMLVVWMIVIGPLDFLLVTRLLKRPELTWATFPACIAVGAIGIWYLSGSKGDLRVHQLDLVDISGNAEERNITTRSWISLSSPDTVRINCAAKPALSETPAGTGRMALGWSGRAEDVFGAMYRKGGVGLGQQSFQHSVEAAARLGDVPLLADGSRGFQTICHDTADARLYESDLSVSGFGMLNGQFTHHLPGGLSQWIVVHGNRVYQSAGPDSQVLEPGAVWDAASEDVVTADLKGYLNASRVVQDQATANTERQRSSQVISPYNSKSRDPMYLVNMLSFYDFAGGMDYVGLAHSQFRFLEVSDTIRLNHAVLIGKLDMPATSFEVNDHVVKPSESSTLVRVFLPVDRRPPGELAKSKEEVDSQPEN